MSQTVINSELSLSKFIGDVRELWREHKYLRVSIKTGKDRSLDQNAISHAWYEQVSRELREGSALDVKCECKLRYGVPILRAEDDEFRAFYDGAVKHALTYEQKVQAMKFIPVTSLMTVKQLSEYLVAMQEGYRGRVDLQFPPEEMPPP